MPENTFEGCGASLIFFEAKFNSIGGPVPASILCCKKQDHTWSTPTPCTLHSVHC